MGKGKGNINNNICYVRAGMVLISLNTTDSKFSHATLKSIQTHLGVKSTIYTKLGCLVLFFNIGIFGHL
jgi:ribosomal protein L16/L10AE